jgi:hypothetical protein
MTRHAVEAVDVVKVCGTGDAAVRALDGVLTLTHCRGGLDTMDPGSARLRRSGD